MGYYSNHSKVSEHLEGVSDMLHTGYQAILWCFAFTTVQETLFQQLENSNLEFATARWQHSLKTCSIAEYTVL